MVDVVEGPVDDAPRSCQLTVLKESATIDVDREICGRLDVDSGEFDVEGNFDDVDVAVLSASL